MEIIQRILDKLYRIKMKKKFRYTKGEPYIIKPLYIVGGDCITLGDGFSSAPGVRIEAWKKFQEFSFTPQIIIGDNVSINYNSHIGAINQIIIGNGVLIGSDVLIIDHDHGRTDSVEELSVRPARRKLLSKGPILIGDNVWIGEKACILSGVTIGEGAIIGASSVVTKDIPAYSVVAGNPAHIVKRLR